MFCFSVTPYERQINIGDQNTIPNHKKKHRQKKDIKSNKDVSVSNSTSKVPQSVIHEDVEESSKKDTKELNVNSKNSHCMCRGWFECYNTWTNPPIPSKVPKRDNEGVQQVLKMMKEIVSRHNLSTHFLTQNIILRADAAHNWADFRRAQEHKLDTSHGDISVLWSGEIKPLIRPQHQFSLG